MMPRAGPYGPLLLLIVVGFCVHPSIGCNHHFIKYGCSNGLAPPSSWPVCQFLCGWNNYHRKANLARGTPRIVGGSSVAYGDLPYQVYIALDNKHYCGGTLVGTRWVLTAAHCVDGFVIERLTFGLAIDDSLGNGEFKKVTKAKAIRVHESYDNIDLDNDIAIVFLNEDVEEFLDIHKIWSACLPEDDTILRHGDMAVISGWGDTRMQTPNYENIPGSPPVLVDPYPLQAVSVEIIGNEECNDMMESAEPNYVWQWPDDITDGKLCAGFQEGHKDGCQGDSGGPIVIFKNGNAVLIGISSYGYGCGYPNHPGVYTRLTEYIPWVKRAMEEMPNE